MSPTQTKQVTCGEQGKSFRTNILTGFLWPCYRKGTFPNAAFEGWGVWEQLWGSATVRRILFLSMNAVNAPNQAAAKRLLNAKGDAFDLRILEDAAATCETRNIIRCIELNMDGWRVALGLSTDEDVRTWMAKRTTFDANGKVAATGLHQRTTYGYPDTTTVFVIPHGTPNIGLGTHVVGIRAKWWVAQIHPGMSKLPKSQKLLGILASFKAGLCTRLRSDLLLVAISWHVKT